LTPRRTTLAKAVTCGNFSGKESLDKAVPSCTLEGAEGTSGAVRYYRRPMAMTRRTLWLVVAVLALSGLSEWMSTAWGA